MSSKTYVYVLIFILSIGTSWAQNKNNNQLMQNKKIIETAFQQWKDGTGSVFSLLDENVIWTVQGYGKLSQTFNGKKALMDNLVPLNKRFKVSLKPEEIKGIYADGDMVIAYWKGIATAIDDIKYENTYAWFLTVKNGKITKVDAFLDTNVMLDLYQRIPLEN